jgi:hypothetical protein
MAWIQHGVDILGEAPNDYSGGSISISSDGTVVAVGAAPNDGAGSNSGHVRVYAWNGATWAQRGSDIDGEAANDYSAGSISLSTDGSVIAIGATNNDGGGADSGHVRVYEWNGTAWVQRGSDINGEAISDYFGYRVSLSSDGSVVAVGAIYNDGNGANSGQLRVYAWSGSAWVQRGTDIDGEAAGDQLGGSVSLSADGTVVAVGASGNDGNGSNAGHVRVYIWNGNDWVQRGADIDGEATGDFLRSVSLSANGAIVATGAAGNDGNGSSAGHVRVYTWNGTAWVQRGADIDGEAPGDSFGYNLSLSSDGDVVAIGAVANDGGGTNSGHVSVYRWNGTAWTKRGADIDGKAAGEQAGADVSLSSDGTIVAVGVSANSGNGANSGCARVYRFTDPRNLSVVRSSNQITISFTPDIPTPWSFTFPGSSFPILNVDCTDNGDGTYTYSFSDSSNTYPTGSLFELTIAGITISTTIVSSGDSGSGGAGSGSGTVPCFFGDAPVLTVKGYVRMDAIAEGDKVMTPVGSEATVERVKCYRVAAGSSTNPYVIPKGRFGATQKLLISPDHRVQTAEGLIEAKKLGLKQEAREGFLTYYNLELAGGANMVVAGVAVESLAAVKRMVVPRAVFERLLTAKYGGHSAAEIAKMVARTCRTLTGDRVEIPVMRR